MHEANLTRFGPLTVESRTHTENFRAMEGPGTLAVSGSGSADVLVNGQPVDGDVVSLKKDNAIEIKASGEATVRVRQLAQADIGIVCQGYFGLNTTDIEKQRDFYKMLGFIGEIYPAGPETSQMFAQALGFEDDYLIHVSLHSLQDPPTMPFVDTVQFREDSYREEPPYARLNHLGMTYATYSTTDLQGAYEFLVSQGVEFLSEPATAPNGERFVFMKEQDGAFIKLVAVEGEVGSAPNFQRLVNTNMNVSDLERSREFYRLLGFSGSAPGAQSGDGEFAAAHGFDSAIEFKGEDVSLGEGTDGATIQLRQWVTPYDDEPPYPPPVNHLGIDRINFYVKDLTAAVKTMNDLGFEQLGPIGGMPEVGIVFFYDPDGIKFQIAGPQNVS